MAVQSSWPYIEEKHGAEGYHHLRLKRMAIFWLQPRGIRPENVVAEQYLGDFEWGSRGYADLYANQDGIEVFIECETNMGSPHTLSRGGKEPARNGKAVYVFTDDGIWLLSQTTVTTEHRRTGKEMSRKIFEVDKVDSLPMLDFSAYKDG